MSESSPATEGKSQMLPSALNDSTFITALDKQARGGAPGEEDEKYVPGGLDRVNDLHGKVTHIVHNLSDKLGLVLKKQEKDFLSAYRAHMYNVQKELQNLRSKVDEAELAMKKDAKIVGLQKERNWFRKEALRLDAFATNIKKDLKFMREKLLTIEEDRNWLEKQLKASKKQNKLLRAELEIRLSSTPVHTPMDDPRAMSPMFPPTRQSGRSMTATPSMGMRGPIVGDARNSGMHRSKSQKPKASAKIIAENKDLKENVRMLKRQLKVAQNELINLHAATVEQDNEKSDLEELFLRCVDTVKRDVERRKAEPSTGFKATRTKRQQEGGHNSLGRVSPPVKLSQFTAPDRRRVVEELLSQDEVLAYLYDALFPPSEEEEVGMEGSNMEYEGEEYNESMGQAGDYVNGEPLRVPTSITATSNAGEQAPTLKLDPQIKEYLRNVRHSTM
jgi:hypothetical protein